MTELQIQAKCWLWHWNAFPWNQELLRRIKNELDNHPRKSAQDIKIQLSENKATGIRPGTPDFMYLINPMVWIEMKAPKGIQSKEQKEFQEVVMDLGHAYFLVIGKTDEQIINNFKQLIHDLNN